METQGQVRISVMRASAWLEAHLLLEQGRDAIRIARRVAGDGRIEPVRSLILLDNGVLEKVLLFLKICHADDAIHCPVAEVHGARQTALCRVQHGLHLRCIRLRRMSETGHRVA